MARSYPLVRYSSSILRWRKVRLLYAISSWNDSRLIGSFFVTADMVDPLRAGKESPRMAWPSRGHAISKASHPPEMGALLMDLGSLVCYSEISMRKAHVHNERRF